MRGMELFKADYKRLLQSYIPLETPSGQVRFKTRKLPLIGYQAYEGEVDFTWTAQSDYETKKLNNMPKLLELRLSSKSNSESGLGSIQLAFTDGISSPVMSASGAEEASLDSHRIEDGASIRTIIGQAIVGARNTWINKLVLRNEKQVLAEASYSSSYGVVESKQTLGAQEAIIGLYGVKSGKKFIRSLGFIVCDTACWR